MAPHSPRVSIGRLPTTGPDLYGREKDLGWLDACWASRVHVAVVVAWGGVGKSALVNKWLATRTAAPSPGSGGPHTCR